MLKKCAVAQAIIVTYSSLINAHAKSDDVLRADHRLARMLEVEPLADVVSNSTVRVLLGVHRQCRHTAIDEPHDQHYLF